MQNGSQKNILSERNRNILEADKPEEKKNDQYGKEIISRDELGRMRRIWRLSIKPFNPGICIVSEWFQQLTFFNYKSQD